VEKESAEVEPFKNQLDYEGGIDPSKAQAYPKVNALER
jgi:hypothetical protein